MCQSPLPVPTVLPKSRKSLIIFVIYTHTHTPINKHTKMRLGLQQTLLKH